MMTTELRLDGQQARSFVRSLAPLETRTSRGLLLLIALFSILIIAIAALGAIRGSPRYNGVTSDAAYRLMWLVAAGWWCRAVYRTTTGIFIGGDAITQRQMLGLIRRDHLLSGLNTIAVRMNEAWPVVRMEFDNGRRFSFAIKGNESGAVRRKLSDLGLDPVR